MRDLSIDAVRGLCIASMIVAHVSMGSLLYSLSHVQLWTDAAFGFVSLSGLVLGIVHRKKNDRQGSPAFRSVAKRVWVLYATQFGLLVLALFVRSIGSRPEELPEPADFGGWGMALGLVASLQIPAPNLTILPMYVALLLAALGVLALLSHGRTVMPIVLSSLIYVASLVFPDQTVMPYLAHDPAPQFNWASWQLPFVFALVIGWHWSSARIKEQVLSTRFVGLAAVVAAAVFVFAQLFERTELIQGSTFSRGVEIAFDKFNLGPGAVIYGAAGIVLLYWLAVQLESRNKARPLLRILVTVGQRSLDSFVILCLAVILLPAIFRYEQDSVMGMLMAPVIFAVCWGWALFRRKRTRMSSHSVVAAPETKEFSMNSAGK